MEARRTRWFHRHPKWARSILAFVAIFASLILAELSARVLCPEWLSTTGESVKFFQHDELLGWSHVPNQRGRFSFVDFSVEIAHNSLGLRDDEYPVERTSKRRMIVLGDSFGWGWGVEHQERFSELLEASHDDWEIINACVAGYGTAQEYLYLKEHGLKFKPDIVLLQVYDNDFENNVLGEQHWHFKPYFSLEDGGLLLHNSPVPSATLGQRFDRFWTGRTYLGRKFTTVKCIQFGLANKVRIDMPQALKVTSAILQEVKSLCDRHGAKLVIVSSLELQKRMEAFKVIAHDLGIRHLELTAHLAAASGRGPIRFPHDPHWNPAGHAAVAESLDRFLLDDWK